MALAVQDCRPAVVSGSKTPDFVGLQRGGFGNPFDVTTDSGQPLADDVAAGLERSLKQAGYRVRLKSTVTSESFHDLVEDLKTTRASRLLIVRINEWKADTAVNTGLYYDLTADVLDGGGHRLGRAVVRGKDDAKGDLFNPAGRAKEAAPQAFWAKMTRLMNDDAISKAMENPHAVEAPPAAAAPNPALPPPEGD